MVVTITETWIPPTPQQCALTILALYGLGVTLAVGVVLLVAWRKGRE
jgi:hypothetical protein